VTKASEKVKANLFCLQIFFCVSKQIYTSPKLKEEEKLLFVVYLLCIFYVQFLNEGKHFNEYKTADAIIYKSFCHKCTMQKILRHSDRTTRVDG
jgi:hypothetical protein